jgi:hypothetical protein
MSLAALIRSMAAAGATAEAIAIAVEAIEAAQANDPREAKRAADRERMRRKRDMSQEVARQSRDTEATVADIPLSPALSPQTPQTHPHTPGVNTTRARGCRLPEAWAPEDGDWLASVDALGGDVAATNELDRFRDYWRAVPGAKGLKLDWPATWRNWVRRASENQKPRKAYDRPDHHNRQAPRQDRLQRLLAGAMAAVDEREHGLG